MDEILVLVPRNSYVFVFVKGAQQGLVWSKNRRRTRRLRDGQRWKDSLTTNKSKTVFTGADRGSQKSLELSTQQSSCLADRLSPT